MTGCVAMVSPLDAPAGCVETLRCVGGPCATPIGDDCTCRLGLEVEKPSVTKPNPFNWRFVNVATPATAATDVVPTRVALPEMTDAVTVAVEVAITRPALSEI